MPWQDDYKQGAIIAYLLRPNNAPHHVGPIGKLISYALSFGQHLDSTITHVGLVHSISNESPAPGYTKLKVVDTLDGYTVGVRHLERNYALEVYALKENLILQDEPRVTSEDLAKKALEVAEGLQGIAYNRWKLLDVVRFHLNEDSESVDAQYTQHLCNRFHIDVEQKTFLADKNTETLICPELVISSYQIAWLLLAGKDAAQKPMPTFININPRISTAGLINFLRHNPCFEPVSPESNHAIRYSGTRHPNDTDTGSVEMEPLGYSTVRFSVYHYLRRYTPTPPPSPGLKIK